MKRLFNEEDVAGFVGVRTLTGDMVGKVVTATATVLAFQYHDQDFDDRLIMLLGATEYVVVMSGTVGDSDYLCVKNMEE